MKKDLRISHCNEKRKRKVPNREVRPGLGPRNRITVNLTPQDCLGTQSVSSGTSSSSSRQMS